MRVFTTYLREDRAPVMVCEGFSFSAFVFGWIYLLWHRAWIPAALNVAAALIVFALTNRTGSLAPVFGLLVLQGLFGRDLRRWSLERSGFVAGPILAAPDEDIALARLFTMRSDLAVTLAGARI